MINNLTIAGRLTSDPELRHTAAGIAVCEFAVAVKRPGSKEVTDFISCVSWRSSAEYLCRNYRKGQPIGIIGQLQQRVWTDKAGIRHQRLEVSVQDICWIGGGKAE